MISFFIKHKKSILIVTLAFFLGSIVYLGLDAYHRGHLESATAAQVGSAKIPTRLLYRVTDKRADVKKIKPVHPHLSLDGARRRHVCP